MGKENIYIPKEELEKFYLDEKLPMSKIAKMFNCTHNSIAIKMKKYDIKPRTTSESVKLFIKKKKINVPGRELIKLYQKEIPLNKIAENYNCSINTIMRRLRENGISVNKSKGVRTNIKKKDLEKLYKKQKLTTYEIAEKYDCCQATIWKKLVEFNIPRRTPYELNSNVPSKKELIKLYIDKKLSTWEIQKRHGYSRSTIHRKLKKYRIKIRSPAKSHIIYPRKDFSGDLVEEAYLIGFRIGDLRVRKIWNGDTINVDCGSTIVEQIDLIKKLFESYGNVWISKPTKSRRTQVEVKLNTSFSFLLSKEVPKWVLNNKKPFFSFLAGFIDAEGSIKVYKNQARLQIGNYDSNLLFLIRKKLNDFGIECPRVYETDTSNYITPDGYHHNQNYWQLKMCKKTFLLELFKLIEPFIKHQNKIKDLKIAKLNILNRNNKFRKPEYES
ncbi:MAG TPA: hypothetical protein VMZ91_07400 [Candidatus Paceibacterota bacterium]|nr:hypothetical protein [Candidatus Paceibacterota bacterium]